jgi:glycosyltransferase involved in cell wall biosynthesis
MPTSPIFAGERQVDVALRNIPYFVVCSTIEPRKNHLMLLHVWRELVRRYGDEAPKLVIVGNRGWKYESVVAMLEHCPAITKNVVEVCGLTTPALKRLVDGSCALLMPSFAEGYGLPVREALMADVPVIASDIPAFREIRDERLTLLSPINGEAWLDTIRVFAGGHLSRSTISAPRAKPETWTNYFDKIDAFVSGI